MAADAPRAGAVFDALDFQPQVRQFFSRAAAEGRIGQSYLLVGAPGSGQEEAAVAVAQALLCPHGGCGACDDCRRVAAGSHPDLRWERPGSAQGYVVDQVRSVLQEAALAPVRGRAKVFVLDRADRLRDKAANALLKTLEEPTSSTVFLLLAPSAELVLPTVASRCQPVPFAALPRAQAVARLARTAGVTPQEASLALALTADPAAARDAVSAAGVAGREAAQILVGALARPQRPGTWDLLAAAERASQVVKAHDDGLAPAADAVRTQIQAAKKAKRLRPTDARALEKGLDAVLAGAEANRVTAGDLPRYVGEARACGALSDAAADDLLAAIEAAFERGTVGEFLARSAVKERELAATRQVSLQERSSIMEAVGAVEAFLRDVASLGQTAAPPALVTRALGADPSLLAGRVRPEDALAALAWCQHARADIAANVTPRVALEAMLLSIKETLWHS